MSEQFGRPTRRLMIARFPGSHWEHSDNVDWLNRTVLWAKDQPWLEVMVWKGIGTPISVMRNKAIKEARANRCDYLLMVDDDMKPDMEGEKPFLPTVLDWLYYKGVPPCVVGAPYCGGAPNRDVQVFKPGMDQVQGSTAGLIRYERHEAAWKTEIEQVGCIGTGLLFIDLRCLHAIRPPYFFYEYTDDEQTAWKSTEDVPFSRDLALAGVPVFCAWGSWAGHWKPELVGRPQRVTPEEVTKRFYERAQVAFNSPAEIERRKKEQEAYATQVKTSGFMLPPADDGGVPGWFDYAELYDRVVAEAPEGSTLVEVGVFAGRSLVYLAKAAKRANKGLKVIGVDTFAGSQEHKQILEQFSPGALIHDAYALLADEDVLDVCTLMVGDSVQCANMLEGDSVYFVFIDADHTKERVTADLNAWYDVLQPYGGIMAGHDYHYWQGVREGVDEFFGNMTIKRDVKTPEGKSWWEVKL